ncbi:uncharacterized protein LOC124815391 [Hydra vulgaris]|uniref:uncharacterized protein LOC124815391 n=1 Tax=Hydra vulgaris TaxID=6087 RepID=UPI001F5F5430|nr:uncharacterized protein LOC124815391 [Hydra vulgaris]
MVDFIMARFKDLFGWSLSRKSETKHHCEKSKNCLPIYSKNKFDKMRKFKGVDRVVHAFKSENAILCVSKYSIQLHIKTKYDYLLQERVLGIDESKSLDKFISCMNLVYKASSTNIKIEVLDVPK